MGGRAIAYKTDGVPMETISIVACGSSWAIKHADSFLGYANSIEEAVAVGEQLVSWLQGEGRAAELRVASRDKDFMRNGAPRPLKRPETEKQILADAGQHAMAS